MPVRRLKEFLDQKKIKYITITHSPAYTAQEIAAMAHIPGKELAKTVMVKIDNEMGMAVLPANHKVDFDMLKEITEAEFVLLATENEFKSMFPECDPGAMPPFGNLYNMPVYVSEALTKDEEIAFSAGSHTELLKMSYKDYVRLVNPKVMEFSFI
jgi:Ala-tRNA(Pro) deacylase